VPALPAVPAAPDDHAVAGQLDRAGLRGRRHKISDGVLAEEPLCPGYPAGVHHGDQVRTTVVDHIRSRRSGGPDERANLRAYCRSCHSRKTVIKDRGWGNTPREPRRHADR
jgi:5-methylcytosine-specific restriction endonuclease McrA